MSDEQHRTVGVLHPGLMGTSIAAALVSNGHRVLWSPEGRSSATAERAAEYGLRESSLAEMAEAAEVIFSVCPPAEAGAVAAEVARTGFSGTYVDGNAIAPDVTRSLAGTGGMFVDGGIVGPPAWNPGTTRFYLSGDGAERVAALFDQSLVDARSIEGGIGAASALKMCFASWTKGTAALLMTIRAVAREEGVDAALLDEWSISLPDLPGRSDAAPGFAAAKAWRFAGEMEEIAATFRGAGLPGGFYDAAAELYEKLAEFKDRFDPPVTLDEVVAAIQSQRHQIDDSPDR